MHSIVAYAPNCDLDDGFMKMKKTIIAILVALGVAGCASTSPRSTVDNLSISLPDGFADQRELSPPSADGHRHLVWTGPDKAKIHLMAWPHGPTTDGGPMIAKSEEPISVAGQQTKLIKTQEFFGSPGEVLVVHLKQGKSRYIVFADNMTPESFKSILKSISIAKD
jgi:hypothetical protein